MALQIQDKKLGLEAAYVRIDYYTVNPGVPNEEKDEEGNVINSVKTYNVNLFLQYLGAPVEGVYRRECVTIQKVLEKDLNFKTFYARLVKDFEEFAEAEKV